MAEIKALFTPMLMGLQSRRMQLQLERELEALRKELKRLPKGTLYIYKKRRWINIYLRSGGETRGITRDRKRVYALARQEYISLLIRFIEAFLSDFSGDYPGSYFDSFLTGFEKLFSKYERACLDIDRIVMTPNQYIWNSSRESKSKLFREELIYPTIGRIYMRSKSEQSLGNLLERLHIPYRYEAELFINGITYHPDFIIMLPSGRMIIIEHAGRLDLKKYNENLFLRLQSYNDAGLLIGREVFFTFERDTRDESILKEVLFQILTAAPSDNKFLRRIAVQAGCRFD